MMLVIYWLMDWQLRLLRCRLAVFPAAGTFLAVMAGALPAAAAPNVLFIAIDDLRADFGRAAGVEVKTPNLDAFGRTSRVFSHHYVQVPTCGASRAALLRGKYPTLPAHMGNEAIRQTHPEWGRRSLPAVFRQGGYQTLAVGKVGHYPGGLTGTGWAQGPEELPGAWSRHWIPETPWESPQAMMHGYARGVARKSGVSPAWEAVEGPDESYPDAWIASAAAAALNGLSGQAEPWFFCVGFFKPHLPFAAPQKWHDPYDAASGNLAMETIPDPEEGVSWHGSREFRGNYGHGGKDPSADASYARQLRRAYAACVSYVDAQVGRVLDALEAAGLAGKTIVVIWSDHGFLLGEHGIWGKHCLYEEALRSTLMIRMPGMPMPGQASEGMVETVDLFPTLTDLCGLHPPAGLDGRSLRPQLMDPGAPGAEVARSFWTSGMRTIRTAKWRLTASASAGEAGRKVELFDHDNDPGELRNVAEVHEAVVTKWLKTMGTPVLETPDPAK